MNQLVEWVLYQSALTCFFLGQKALLALPPWLPCLRLTQTTANWTTPSPLSPSLFFVFTCFLSFRSNSCSKTQSSQAACHLWQRSDLTSWSLTHPHIHAVFLQCGPVAVMSPFFVFSSMFTGLGYCLTFLPTVTILAQYFSRRRALVISIASSGESFAIFAFAPGKCSVKEQRLGKIWALTYDV